MNDSKDHKDAAEPPLDYRVSHAKERVLRKAAEARARAYSAEITRLEKEVQHYQALYVEQQNENRELRGELILKIGSTSG